MVQHVITAIIKLSIANDGIISKCEFRPGIHLYLPSIKGEYFAVSLHIYFVLVFISVVVEAHTLKYILH